MTRTSFLLKSKQVFLNRKFDQYLLIHQNIDLQLYVSPFDRCAPQICTIHISSHTLSVSGARHLPTIHGVWSYNTCIDLTRCMKKENAEY